MTPEEFHNLDPGDIIECPSIGQYKIIGRRNNYWKVLSLTDQSIGYASEPFSWILIRKYNDKIIQLGGKYDNRGV